MDAYDKEIEELTANPELIPDRWDSGFNSSLLFSGSKLYRDFPGCLTMLRNRQMVQPETPTELEILNDQRLPSHRDDITIEHLPIFAEWHRILDEELGREPITSAYINKRSYLN